MKILKNLTLIFAIAFCLAVGTKAFAEGVGFVDYKKVQDNFAFAQAAAKEVDNKGLELQQFLVDKEKQYKSLDTPLKKQNFEDKTKKEFEAKQSAYITFKLKKEEEVYNKIQAAAKQVMIEQKLDAIFDYRVIFVGGLDVTDLVISKLKTAK
ncbi:OmpH family outer membrane protein [bacterium]|nr:OmpH family outer membrane protein [bacterium]